MKDNHLDYKEESQEEEITKEEINLQFHWYMLGFFIIYFISFLFPGLILVFYVTGLYIPLFLEMETISSIFMNYQSLLIAISMPLIVILSYLLHLFLIGLSTKWLWSITENRSPSKEGIIPRNIASKSLNYYHIRSFLIKYGKNVFQKGPFPWFLNWFYNFVGANRIGKGTTIEEQFGADKFVEIGENSYIGVNSGFSSHSLEGIFGNISYFKIELGDNVTTAGINCVAPGVEISDNSYLLPMASAVKHSKLKGDNYYFGVPLRRIFKRKITDYLDISREDLKKADNLAEKQQESNNEKENKKEEET
ncbi:MAG: hypothetical protein EU548_06225 [Promethearchaeota archaeon]|nr:MAG: hypothetical protein EU548_06225 [Candidatus Lokiarchaeota archaeon]